MSDFACSFCGLLFGRFTNYKPLQPWALLVCQPCITNGALKTHAKRTYNLMEAEEVQEKLAALKREVAEPAQSRESFLRDENLVVGALIRPAALEFAQKFVTFTGNILKEQPTLQPALQQAAERIQELTENHTKRVIIDEVKTLNQSIIKEVQINRKNVGRVYDLGKQIRRRVSSLAYESANSPLNGQSIFSPEDANSTVVVLNRKAEEMEVKAGALTRLSQEGDYILTAEVRQA